MPRGAETVSDARHGLGQDCHQIPSKSTKTNEESRNMSAADNVQTEKDMYAAFQRGDRWLCVASPGRDCMYDVHPRSSVLTR